MFPQSDFLLGADDRPAHTRAMSSFAHVRTHSIFRPHGFGGHVLVHSAGRHDSVEPNECFPGSSHDVEFWAHGLEDTGHGRGLETSSRCLKGRGLALDQGGLERAYLSPVCTNVYLP